MELNDILLAIAKEKVKLDLLLNGHIHSALCTDDACVL